MPLVFQIAADLDGNIAAVRVVDEVFEGNDKAVTGAVCRKTIVMIVDGNKTNAFSRKQLLNVLSGVDILTTETRQIFYDNAVDLAAFHGLHHLLEVWPVKICSGVAIVYILGNQFNVRAFADEGVDQISLTGYTVALPFSGRKREVAIFLRQSKVVGGFEDCSAIKHKNRSNRIVWPSQPI